MFICFHEATQKDPLSNRMKYVMMSKPPTDHQSTMIVSSAIPLFISQFLAVKSKKCLVVEEALGDFDKNKVASSDNLPMMFFMSLSLLLSQPLGLFDKSF